MLIEFKNLEKCDIWKGNFVNPKEYIWDTNATEN